MQSFLERLTIYRRSFGRRGLWLAVRARLSSAPFEVETMPPRGRAPVTLRLKTSDFDTFQKVFLDAEYAVPLGRSPRTILDAGANVGFASIYFATVYPDAKILAVEPEESNFNLLKKNVEPYPNVTPIRAALWKYNGAIDLVDPGIGHWGFQARDTTSGPAPRLGTVQARTVDGLMADYGWDSIDLMKIDIEGAERDVFADPSMWIDHVGVLAVELHDRYQIGCSRNFYLATSNFDLELQNGENVF